MAHRKHMVPKEIRDKIKQNNTYIYKAIALSSQIIEWYNKQLDKYDDVIDFIDDEEFGYVYGYERADLISLSNMEDNLKLLKEKKGE